MKVPPSRFPVLARAFQTMIRGLAAQGSPRITAIWSRQTGEARRGWQAGPRGSGPVSPQGPPPNDGCGNGPAALDSLRIDNGHAADSAARRRLTGGVARLPGSRLRRPGKKKKNQLGAFRCHWATSGRRPIAGGSLEGPPAGRQVPAAARFQQVAYSEGPRPRSPAPNRRRHRRSRTANGRPTQGNRGGHGASRSTQRRAARPLLAVALHWAIVRRDDPATSAQRAGRQAGSPAPRLRYPHVARPAGRRRTLEPRIGRRRPPLPVPNLERTDDDSGRRPARSPPRDRGSRRFDRSARRGRCTAKEVDGAPASH